MGTLAQYITAIEQKKVTGDFILNQGCLETRTIGYDEYIDSINVLFENCQIRDITLTSSDFMNCTFRNCIFSGGSMNGVCFRNCIIESLIFQDVDSSISFEKCITDTLHFYKGWEKAR